MGRSATVRYHDCDMIQVALRRLVTLHDAVNRRGNSRVSTANFPGVIHQIVVRLVTSGA